jgi:nucleoid-associated protein Lsr2
MNRINDQNGAAVMAQKVQTLFVDDLDGSGAEGTVRFGLDGTEYEIDLNAKHAQQFRDALARYVAAGRRVRASTRQPARTARKAQPNALNTTEVREWAKAQGIDVKDRGRIPAELVVKFKAATAAPRGAVLYRSRSEQGWEELSLDLMAYLDLKGEGDNSMPGNRQLMPRRMGWCAGGSA